LNHAEIIIQTADVRCLKDIGNDSSLLRDDDVIFPESSLAYALMNDPSCPKGNKKFFGTPDKHGSIEDDLYDIGLYHLNQY
jgi:hypothetical protein